MSGKPQVKVPLLDLKAQNGALKTQIQQAMDAVIESNHFIMGPQVEAFEKQVASYLDVKHAIGRFQRHRCPGSGPDGHWPEAQG